MKIIEITNVDFSLRHFLLPLMRAIRARGHEVVGMCAEGTLLEGVRAEGFRIVPVPFARRLSPLAHARAFRDLVRLLRAERPDSCTRTCRSAAFWPGWRRGSPACLASPTRATGSCSTRTARWLRRAGGFAMEWIGGRVTDVFMTVSTSEAADARRLHIFRDAVAVGNGRDPARVPARPGRACRRSAPRWVRRRIAWWSSRSRGWFATRAIRNWPRQCATCRRRSSGWWASGSISDRGDDMAALLAESGLGDRLRLLGYREDVAALLAAADIFVLPS